MPFSPGRTMIEVSDGNPKRHPRNLSEGVPLWRPLAGQEWEGVFLTDFVQVSEIHAHSSFPIFLFNHYYVGQPLGVKNFFNGPSLLQLIYLCLDYLGVIFG